MGPEPTPDAPEPMPLRPGSMPIGLFLTRVARIVGRSFDEALVEVGGSLPVWLVLINLKAHPGASQRAIAQAMGITEATLTHHLNVMDGEGLVSRQRDPSNRRVHVLQLTEAGEAAFVRLRSAATSFDSRLRSGLDEQDLAQLRSLLGRLATNVGAGSEAMPPWAGLVEPRRQR